MEIPFGLTRDLDELFEQTRQHPKGTHPGIDIMTAVHKAIQNGEVLWRSEISSSNLVVRCNDKVVVKVIPRTSDYTEFTSLQYLQDNFPAIPKPRPLGVISCGPRSYIFMTYVPGISLDTIWINLDAKQKRSLMSDLGQILQELRQMNTWRI